MRHAALVLLAAASLVAACGSPGPPPAPAPAAGSLLLDLYDVSDLAGPSAEPLAERVRREVDPDLWTRGEGDLELRAPGTLVVRAPASTHAKIRALLADLRAAR